MTRAHGRLLLIAVLLSVYALATDRALFFSERSPVFLSPAEDMVTVELAAGFPLPGIHQFIDGTTREDVIKLTNFQDGSEIDWLGARATAIHTGERFELLKKTSIKKEVRVSWMAASKRVALGIPLHPDRMSQDDWTVLPGIGVSLAEKIENNRQNYGEFGTFENLKRVSGIGEKRLSSWNQYFFSE